MPLKNSPIPLLDRFWTDNRLIFISSILFALVTLRIALNVFFFQPFDADECATVLMAMDLLKEPRFIVGWMGQDYMGSLEIYLLSIWGAYLGWSVGSIRLAMASLVLCELVIIYRIAIRIYRGTAGVFVLISILVLSSPIFYNWGLRARSYQLSVVIVLFALFIAVVWSQREHKKKSLVYGNIPYFFVGLSSGMAIWQNELSVCLIPAIFFFIWHGNSSSVPNYIAVIVGIFAGYTPRILYNLMTDFDGIKLLAGTFLNFSRADFEQYGLKCLYQNRGAGSDPVSHFRSILTASGWPFLFLATAGGVFFLIVKVKEGIRGLKVDRFTVGLCVSVLCSLLITTKERYVTFAIAPAVLLTGAVLSHLWSYSFLRIWIKLAVAASLLFAFGHVIAQYPIFKKPPATIQLTNYLQKKGYHRGISGYYIAHPVMVYSGGEIIVSSLGGPFFTTRLLRFEREVAKEGAEFIVYRKEHEELVSQLKKYLSGLDLSWKQEIIADEFLVFHSFPRPIFPGEFLSEENKAHFKRHNPASHRKLKQERANELKGKV